MQITFYIALVYSPDISCPTIKTINTSIPKIGVELRHFSRGGISLLVTPLPYLECILEFA